MRLYAHAAFGANSTKELERLDVAAEQHVLSVVDDFAAIAIDECRGAPAQPRFRLEDEHAGAAGGHPYGGAQTGKSRADDNRVVFAFRTHFTIPLRNYDPT